MLIWTVVSVVKIVRTATIVIIRGVLPVVCNFCFVPIVTIASGVTIVWPVTIVAIATVVSTAIIAPTVRTVTVVVA